MSLGDIQILTVGQRLLYAAVDPSGRWLAVLVFNAAAKHLKARDQWIGWNRTQRERRLSLVANNSRFLILPDAHQPNLGSRVLRQALDRLSDDWLAAYGHPLLVVETFVDPEQFQGTVYTAQGWQELGQTDSFGRHRRDFYVAHDKPKRLFAKELSRNPRRSLQAERLKPSLAPVERKAGARCHLKPEHLRTIAAHLADLPDYRSRTESYPAKALAAIILLAMLCDAPRSQKDLAKLARRLTQAQRCGLGVRPLPNGFYPAPSQSNLLALPGGDRRPGPPGTAAGHPVEDPGRRAGRGADRPRWQAAQARLQGVDPGGGHAARAVPAGMRASRCQDQRGAGGARPLWDDGPGRAHGLDGRAAHLRADGAGAGDGTRGARPADGQGEPAHADTEHREGSARPHGGFFPLTPPVARMRGPAG